MANILNGIFIFLMGVSSCLLFMFIVIDHPFQESNINAPGDWVKSNQIEVNRDYIVIYISNTSLSAYAATGSMRPTLDAGANGIRITPTSAEDINIGDIISYNSNNDLVVHRVIEKGLDEKGYWFNAKGDNNKITDDTKIRFDEIKYVTIGILY